MGAAQSRLEQRLCRERAVQWEHDSNSTGPGAQGNRDTAQDLALPPRAGRGPEGTGQQGHSCPKLSKSVALPLDHRDPCRLRTP